MATFRDQSCDCPSMTIPLSALLRQFPQAQQERAQHQQAVVQGSILVLQMLRGGAARSLTYLVIESIRCSEEWQDCRNRPMGSFWLDFKQTGWHSSKHFPFYHALFKGGAAECFQGDSAAATESSKSFTSCRVITGCFRSNNSPTRVNFTDKNRFISTRRDFPTRIYINTMEMN